MKLPLPKIVLLAAILWWVSLTARPVDADTPAGSPPPRPSASSADAARETVATGDGEPCDALLADIRKARETVLTLRARFTQIRKLTLLATTVKSTGQLSFVAPERLRWELAAPDEIVYLVGPEGLSYRTHSSSATLAPNGSGSTGPRALGDLRALLGGDLAKLSPRYELSCSRTSNEVAVQGRARDKITFVRAFVLTLDKTLRRPIKATLTEGKADTIEILFSDAEINTIIAANLMRP